MTEDPFLHEDTKPLIMPPQDGWQEHAVYLVAVSWSPTNPVHRALLNIGFVNEDGSPGNYSEIWANDYDEGLFVRDAHYLRVIKQLATAEEMDKP